MSREELFLNGKEASSSQPKNSRKDHGTTTGATIINAVYSNHTLTTATSQTWTLTEFSKVNKALSVKLTITGGTPTITLSGGTPTIASDSDQTLTTMATGVYFIKGESFDDGTTSEWFISQIS